MPVPPIPDFAPGETAGVSTKLDQLSTALSFMQNPPQAVASYNTAGNLGTGAWSGFNLVEIVDTDTMHDDVTNPSRLTIRTAGRYLITATASFATNATGGRAVQVRKNAGNSAVGGTQLAQSAVVGNATTGSSPFVTFEAVLIVGDYLEMFAIQGSGGNLAMIVNHPFFYMSARWTAVS